MVFWTMVISFWKVTKVDQINEGEHKMQLLLGITMTVVALMAEGFCGMKLWNWFIPLWIPSAPELTFGIACGLGLVVRRFIGNTDVDEVNHIMDDGEEGWLNALRAMVVSNMISPFLALFIGWVIMQLI